MHRTWKTELRGESLDHASAKLEKACDAQELAVTGWKAKRAPSTEKTKNSTRPSQRALDFVFRFNDELGLSDNAKLAKLKHMLAPRSFLTAIPALFYQDVRGPFRGAARLRETDSPEGLLVGDAHLGNLKTLTGPDGKTVWGWGDCDKSGKGRLEWDLERLATHTVLWARASKKHFSKTDEEELIAAISRGYTDALREFATTGVRPPAYLRADELKGALRDFVKKRSRQSQVAFVDKLAPNGALRRETRIQAVDAGAIRAAIADYERRLPADAPVAQPINVLSTAVSPANVGGSNSGLVRFLALVQPADPSAPNVVLKFKQVLPSPTEDGSGNLATADAAALVENAAVLQGMRDPLLGYATIHGRSTLVWSMEAGRDILEPEQLGKKDFLNLAKSAGLSLARSHLQTETLTKDHLATWLGDPSTDEAATRRLVHFGRHYADQTHEDSLALKQFLKSLKKPVPPLAS